MNAKLSNLLTLMAIAAIFVAPIGASYYLNAIGWQSGKTKNRGHLLPKPVPMAEKTFSLSGSKTLSLASMKHSWALLYAGGKTCQQDCRKRLDELLRVHVALGKNQKRVKLLYLDAAADDSVSSMISNKYPHFDILGNPAESVAAWKTQLDAVIEAKDATGLVFIIDPLGNVIMYYLPAEDAIGIRKDMGRLLHVSRVG